MAHRLNFTNGRASMAYCGETPWHGLGTKVDGYQTAADMMRAAGMQWEVGMEPIMLADGTVIGSHRAIVRQDTRAVLGVGSARYQVFQNAQAGELADALVLEGGAHVEVAGVLDNGEKCWLLAKLPDVFEVTRGDAVVPHFLLAWGHDAKHGIAGKLTEIRVVCWNTLHAALPGKWSQSADLYLRHSKNLTVRLEEARAALGIVRKQNAETADLYRALAQREVSDVEARAYFAGVFPYPAGATVDAAGERARMLTGRERDAVLDAAAESRERVDEVRETVGRLIHAGKGADLAGHTAWGAYNAVTEYTDHVYPVLQSGAVSATRQQSVIAGTYAEIKRTALAGAVALL